MTSLLVGWLRLAVVAVPLGLAAIAVQRRIAPEFDGATATLCRIVIALAIGLVVLEAVGTIGQFRPVVIIVSEALVGIVVTVAASDDPWWVFRRHRGRVDTARPSPSRALIGPAQRLAVAVSAVVLLAWVVISAWTGRHGVLDNDSIRYHGPFVARWFETNSITHLHFTSDRLQETYFPGNSELLSSIGFAAFGSDWLTPLLDIGWLMLALLAGWTLVDGDRRPYGLLAVAAVAGSPLLLGWQPGSARNDVAAAALVLAALSIVRHADWQPGPVAVGGLAAGLALGMKLSVLAPVVVITIGLVPMAPKGRRARVASSWTAPMAVTGSFWFIRNWVRTGNPLPWYHLDLGPVRLPSPPFVYVSTEGRSIADFATSGHFWLHTVPAGLERSVGIGWPVLVAMCACGVVGGLLSRRWFPTLLAAAALAGFIADLFTPYTAGGGRGPTLFPTQLRFLTLAAFLALLAGVEVLDRRWLWMFSALAAATLSAGMVEVPRYEASLAGVAVALAAVAVVSLRRWPAVRPRHAATAAALLAICASVPYSQWYRSHRFLLPHESGPAAAFAYFRDVHRARIAVGSFVRTYPLNGSDLSNWVQIVGTTGAHGAFRPAADCRTWQRLVDRGRYGYVVVGSDYHARQRRPHERAWTSRMPNARLVLHSGTTSVFRLSGGPVPPRCPPSRRI